MPALDSPDYCTGASHAGLSWRSHELLAHLLQFHRREEKPFWWQRFAWRAMEASELYHELDCLAGLQRTSREPYKPTPRSRSLAYEYTFNPNQDTKLRSKTSCWLVPSEDGMKGTVAELDAERGHVVITFSQKKLDTVREQYPHWEPPEQTSLVPCDLVKADKLAKAIHETVSDWQSSQTLQPALRDLLERRVPRFRDRQQGPIITESNQLLSQTIEAIAQLDRSVLCIQGPPGSGKTSTASHGILNLLKQGKRVAVTSNSHKAIANLLKRTLELAKAKGIDVPAIKKESSGGEPELKEWLKLTKKVEDLSSPEYVLAGATAFALCDPCAQCQWDYLFVDEAGQVSLANLVAMARCSDNIVLIGDQMQLEQPIQGSHPGESGQSALTYLLQDNSTIPPDMGIFLGVSYRMHPDICRFISESVYDNRLLADSETQLHRLDPERWDEQTSKIPTYGIHFIPVHHKGNSQSSDEEISIIRASIEQLLTMKAIGNRGDRCELLKASDILVVAPYNMQVRKLESVLDGMARVGTVDRFQGQEAPVVILSMCASSCDDVPRGLEFLLSPNRINVAVESSLVVPPLSRKV